MDRRSALADGVAAGGAVVPVGTDLVAAVHDDVGVVVLVVRAVDQPGDRGAIGVAVDVQGVVDIGVEAATLVAVGRPGEHRVGAGEPVVPVPGRDVGGPDVDGDHVAVGVLEADGDLARPAVGHVELVAGEGGLVLAARVVGAGVGVAGVVLAARVVGVVLARGLLVRGALLGVVAVPHAVVGRARLVDVGAVAALVVEDAADVAGLHAGEGEERLLVRREVVVGLADLLLLVVEASGEDGQGQAQQGHQGDALHGGSRGARWGGPRGSGGGVCGPGGGKDRFRHFDER